VAVLAGDFMFAQSSWFLANLENIEVIKLISQVIQDLRKTLMFCLRQCYLIFLTEMKLALTGHQGLCKRRDKTSFHSF
jgi:hypothetical protein